MRKVTCAVLAATVLLLSTAIPTEARDGFRRPHRFRGHRGFHSRIFVGHRVFVGPRFWWGPGVWWQTSYGYYVAPPLIVQQEPPAFISPEVLPEPPDYWYYCRNPEGYYPYVEQCPGGWMTVVPPTNPAGEEQSAPPIGEPPPDR